MSNENKVGFLLQNIKTEQFAIFEENYNPQQEIGLVTALQFRLDQEHKQIGVFLAFEFEQAKKKFIKILVSCHFKIEDNSWKSFIPEKKPQIVIPKGFLAHLAMITVGTTRGILFAKTEGTAFAKYIIPTLDVSKLITKDASFDIKQD